MSNIKFKEMDITSDSPVVNNLVNNQELVNSITSPSPTQKLQAQPTQPAQPAQAQLVNKVFTQAQKNVTFNNTPLKTNGILKNNLVQPAQLTQPGVNQVNQTTEMKAIQNKIESAAINNETNQANQVKQDNQVNQANQDKQVTQNNQANQDNQNNQDNNLVTLPSHMLQIGKFKTPKQTLVLFLALFGIGVGLFYLTKPKTTKPDNDEEDKNVKKSKKKK